MDQNTFLVGEFEGPLDLLLFLIKKQEINIYDIPIAKITEQYLAYLEYASQIELDNLTDFYLMAATLLFIKSKMLLPVEVNLDEEIEDPRRELVEKLIEYQKYKKLGELIAVQEDKSEWLIERKSKQNILPFPDEDIWQQIDVWDLLKTFSSLVSSLSTEQIIDLYEEVTINEKITLIREMIEQQEEFLFTEILIKSHSLLAIICSFLAVLEMVKSKEIIVYQNKMFGDIRIKSYSRATTA
ncbi:MAG: segregation/condensation protein A [Spirochaetales bacterium]|nr:segregation/condensation protein A [Spirochaetales bacterium]